MAGAWRGWTLFMRLELIDGSFKEIPWVAESTAARHQAWPAAVAVGAQGTPAAADDVCAHAFFVAATTAAALFQVVPESDSSALAASGVAAAVYWLGLPVLIGSLATADERQFGTLAWQLQLPTPVWQQWAVKVGTVFGLAMLLAVGVPMLLAYCCGRSSCQTSDRWSSWQWSRPRPACSSRRYARPSAACGGHIGCRRPVSALADLAGRPVSRARRNARRTSGSRGAPAGIRVFQPSVGAAHGGTRRTPTLSIAALVAVGFAVVTAARF